jgi:predicted nucleic acid-binding protein
MSEPFVDTDVIIRLITGDDPVKQTAAEALFRQVANGTLMLRAPDTVIADAVYVLASPNLYRRDRSRIRDQLGFLLRLPNFKVHNKRLLLRALDIFAGTSLDFGDAMLVATMRRRGSSDLYSYDRDFDHVVGVRRLEP